MEMRIFLTLGLITLLQSTSVFSQYAKFKTEHAGPGNVGIKIGCGLSDFRGSDASDFQSTTDYSFSIYYTLNHAAGEHLEFSQGLGFNGKGAISKISDELIGLKYIEFDNLFKYKTKTRRSTPFIIAGFYLAALLNGESLDNIAPRDTLTGYQESSKTFDYGPFFGLGYDFGKPNKGVNERLLGIELRYSLGLADLFENKKPYLKNHVIAGILRIFLFNL